MFGMGIEEIDIMCINNLYKELCRWVGSRPEKQGIWAAPFVMLNVDMVIDRETLYERSGGWRHWGDNATVAVHINRLREKLEKDPAHPRYIETVWGAGYRFRG